MTLHCESPAGPAYSAAIFDLFGTLVPPYRHHDVLRNMAEILGVDSDSFTVVFVEETSEAREIGRATLEENLRDTCRHLGEPVGEARIEGAASIRRRFTRASLGPRDDALWALTEIRSKGLAIGVVSDCCQAVAELWESTSLASCVDAAILSFRVGLRKPDRRIYQMVCRELGVEPSQCIYLGGGGHYELGGAVRAGMDAALLRIESELEVDPFGPEARSWDGPRVGSLREFVRSLSEGRRFTTPGG